ncbi:MAG: SusD/RagB family nutrient-binding outer membrane lipoprotein [Rikenellaceae bacterium]|nr:SusD/RagB family nutrient-binding outer membrane lipoprotein [Rikenellaceae bacterium]
MNKFKRYACIAALAFIALPQACTHKFGEYDDNPNEMPLWSLHPAGMMEMLIFSGAEGLLNRTYQLNGELIQYTASGTTTNAYHRYIIPNGVFTSAWNNHAQWASNAHHMIILAQNAGDKNYEAVARTMKVLYVSTLTDLFGDIPYTEAFRLDENITQPRFDRQENIYHELYEELELANSLYRPGETLEFPSKDLLYGGDVDKWKKFNNSLYLRLLMRLSNRDGDFWISGGDNPMSINHKMQQIFNDPVTYPVFESVDDAAILRYTGESQFENMFGSYTDASFNGRKMAEFLVNVMDRVNDPRLASYGVQSGGSWTGMVSGMPTQETDNSGIATLNKDVLGDYTSPYSIMRYDEVMFIWAEAAIRGMISGGQTAAGYYYENGLMASLEYWDSVDPNPDHAYTDAKKEQLLEKLSFNGTIDQIMEQKYVALFFVGYEAWNDYRRTGYPVLTIGSGTANDHILPRRLGYPSRTQETNPVNYAQAVAVLQNTYINGADDMKTPVWWSRAALELSKQ